MNERLAARAARLLDAGEMTEIDALAFAIGVLAGMRDDPMAPAGARKLSGMAVTGLLPRARELGIDLSAHERVRG